VRFIPYITLNGNAAEAVEFYAKVFEATNKGVMRFGDMPNPEFPVPEEARNRVLHAELDIDGNTVFLSDTFPGSHFVLGNQLAIAVMFKDEQRIKAIYGRLSDGGTVLMELQQTFWSPAYAMVSDKFGVLWQLTLETGR
jgi:PhnB protein